MTALAVGWKVRVHHQDGFKYIFHVEVTTICSPNEFMGRVENVFANSPEMGHVGEIDRGDILTLRGQVITFQNADVV